MCELVLYEYNLFIEFMHCSIAIASNGSYILFLLFILTYLQFITENIALVV